MASEIKPTQGNQRSHLEHEGQGTPDPVDLVVAAAAQMVLEADDFSTPPQEQKEKKSPPRVLRKLPPQPRGFGANPPAPLDFNSSPRIRRLAAEFLPTVRGMDVDVEMEK